MKTGYKCLPIKLPVEVLNSRKPVKNRLNVSGKPYKIRGVHEVGSNVSRFQEEMDRVLASETFRSSESLRRLLHYLGGVHLEGTDRSLKEYTIGRDVMGKPADYDPRVDASVRVQIGKLRQRLEQYYREEAPAAVYEIRLPKGHFRLSPEEKIAPLSNGSTTVVSSPPSVRWKWLAVALAVLSTVLAGGLGWQWASSRGAAAVAGRWPDELRDFWRPYVESRRPTVVVLGSPLFVRFHHHYFRNPWANDWAQVEKAVPLKEMEKILNSPTQAAETHRWTPFGEAMAAFRIASVLSPVKEDMMLKRSTVMAWEDVRANNMIFLGPPKFNPQLKDLPITPDFVIEEGGITNRRPARGELGTYKRTSPPEVEDIPEDFALVTRIHGAAGWGEVLVLESTSTEGTWAAADYVTRQEHVAAMVSKMKRRDGTIPDSYQVLLKCRFKAQVPIAVEYITHHELAAPAR